MFLKIMSHNHWLWLSASYLFAFKKTNTNQNSVVFVWKSEISLQTKTIAAVKSCLGFYLRKKETGHAGGRAVLCWARIWPCWARWAIWLCLARSAGSAWRARLGGIWPYWARWAGLGVGFGSGGCAGLGWAWGLAVLGALLGWVGFGFGGCAVLCWVRIWLSVYGLHCTCLLHVFLMSLSLSSCVSQMVSWGLSKTKPGIREWNVVLSNSVFEKCDVKRTKWKRKERNGSSGNQHSLKRTA